jgi:hypothetical protein
MKSMVIPKLRWSLSKFCLKVADLMRSDPVHKTGLALVHKKWGSIRNGGGGAPFVALNGDFVCINQQNYR